MNQAYMTSVISFDDEPNDDTIIIRAHLEYTKVTGHHYAISDTGFTLTILGVAIGL